MTSHEKCEARTMADTDSPSLEEICKLTRSELTTKHDDDAIIGCGRTALHLLPLDPSTCMLLARQQLHAVPYKDVKPAWFRLYTDAALWQAVDIAEARWARYGLEQEAKAKGETAEQEKEDVDWITKVVKLLDMALILAGALGREELVELWFAALMSMLQPTCPEVDGKPYLDEPAINDSEKEAFRHGLDSAGSGGVEMAREKVEISEPPTKRRKLDAHKECSVPETFPATIDTSPMLRHPIPRMRDLGLSDFQSKVSNPDTQTPVIIEGAIDHWPALEEERAWRNPGYLMRKTLQGRRLVPVEIGRSYTDADWGQKILSFGDFMREYMLTGADTPTPTIADRPDNSDKSHVTSSNGDTSSPTTNPPQKGYLAQHDLFKQIPSLRSDICIPDYCYSEPAPTPTNPSNIKPVSKLEEPLLNAWFGPAGTISPLHTDPYHNILAQVVGYKYVRLYAPEETPKLYPRGVDDMGIDMANTSEVDLDEAMRVWGEISCWGTAEAADDSDADERREFEAMYERFRGARYVEGVLGPGDCLYIPVGWWHYVRSLTPSFSVSFWWN